MSCRRAGELALLGALTFLLAALDFTIFLLVFTHIN